MLCRWVFNTVLVACFLARTAVAADVASPSGASPPRFITSGHGFIDYWPVFSPDGKQILFSRSFDGGRSWELWIVGADGGQAHQFAHIPASVSATRANWSPEGHLIAFTGQSGAKASVWTIQADGSNPQELHSAGLSGQVFYPSWYPDGEQVAVMDGMELAIKRLDLARQRAETLTERTRFLTGMPSVSPDGKSIAFAGQPNAGRPYDQTKNTIWLLELGNGEVHSLEATHEQGRAPSWSPDGTNLAFESDRADRSGNHLYAAFIIGRDGTGLRQVTKPEFNANHPVWSPDGRRLVVSADLVQSSGLGASHVLPNDGSRIAIVGLGQ
jgi:Tol biopolymer transport system component